MPGQCPTAHDRRGIETKRRRRLGASLLRGTRPDCLRDSGRAVSADISGMSFDASRSSCSLSESGSRSPRSRPSRQARPEPCAEPQRLVAPLRDLGLEDRRAHRGARTPPERTNRMHRVRLPLARPLLLREPRRPCRERRARPALLDRQPADPVSARPGRSLHSSHGSPLPEARRCTCSSSPSSTSPTTIRCGGSRTDVVPRAERNPRRGDGKCRLRGTASIRGTGPGNRFTGSVYIDTIAAPSGSSRLSASCVHFTPGARTAWHTHPNGQTIWVLEGSGLCQRRGGPVEIIDPATASSSSPAKTTGTAPRRTAS